MSKMSNNILCSLTGMQRGSNKTTVGVNSDMNIPKGAKRLKMSDICLPEGTRGKPSRIDPSMGQWKKSDTGLTVSNDRSSLFASDLIFKAKSMSIKMMECMGTLSFGESINRGGRKERGHCQERG